MTTKGKEYQKNISEIARSLTNIFKKRTLTKEHLTFSRYVYINKMMAVNFHERILPNAHKDISFFFIPQILK
jgi:hypothetical protein